MTSQTRTVALCYGDTYTQMTTAFLRAYGLPAMPAHSEHARQASYCNLALGGSPIELPAACYDEALALLEDMPEPVGRTRKRALLPLLALFIGYHWLFYPYSLAQIAAVTPYAPTFSALYRPPRSRRETR